MATATQAIDRLAPCRRPPANAIGYHRWSDLLFVHWRLPIEVIQPLLPPDLTLDTWDGAAWVGLVPFHMSGVRPWWAPAVPGLSTFHETNVRTYVHCDGANPGVWFFSLEAARSLPVLVARRRWNLNYHRAVMQVSRRGDRVRYSSRRLWPGLRGAGVDIEAQIGGLLGRDAPGRSVPAGQAIPGTLEHFLIERYILYAVTRMGSLLRGRVHHRPYEIREARLERLEQSLLKAADIDVDSSPCHVVYSPGVDVDIFPLAPA